MQHGKPVYTEIIEKCKTLSNKYKNHEDDFVNQFDTARMQARSYYWNCIKAERKKIKKFNKNQVVTLQLTNKTKHNVSNQLHDYVTNETIIDARYQCIDDTDISYFLPFFSKFSRPLIVDFSHTQLHSFTKEMEGLIKSPGVSYIVTFANVLGSYSCFDWFANANLELVSKVIWIPNSWLDSLCEIKHDGVRERIEYIKHVHRVFYEKFSEYMPWFDNMQ